MKISTFKSDLDKLLKCNAEIEKYNTMLLYHNDLTDKKNYSPNLCDQILIKLKDLDAEFSRLYEKFTE